MLTNCIIIISTGLINLCHVAGAVRVDSHCSVSYTVKGKYRVYFRQSKKVACIKEKDYQLIKAKVGAR